MASILLLVASLFWSSACFRANLENSADPNNPDISLGAFAIMFLIGSNNSGIDDTPVDGIANCIIGSSIVGNCKLSL